MKKLNEKPDRWGCVYNLPTDSQLHYLIRADVTGTNTDLYSTGVTDQNASQYMDNKNLGIYINRVDIHPVGQKVLNAFGIELGNVWKMSKDISQSVPPSLNFSLRGGSIATSLKEAKSSFKLTKDSLNRAYGDTGFFTC